ncbi:MAG: SRPBCC family protein [Longimicrobiales bacterium]
MSRVTVNTHINAPVDKVFDTIAHIENFAKAVPHIVSTEFLSDTRSGVGTRFRETRRMGKREVSNDLEVTEYVENDHVRIVTDSHGAVWDTLFSVKEKGGGTELAMVMDGRPYKFLQRLLVPLMNPMVKKAVVADMNAVKGYCESA